jgi:peptide/nickel transport system substrate-binding protein
MKRNPNWWDAAQHNLDTVTFEAIANDATRTAALLSGGVDAILPVPLQDVGRIEHATGFQLLQRPELRTVYFGFDMGDAEIADSSVRGRNPFQDKRVRQAFYQAIDEGAIRARIMRGASAPAGILVAPEINGYDASLNTRLPYDPDAARKLLAEAGYGEGFEVGLDCPTAVFVNDEAICRAVIPMLSRVGVTLRPNIETRAQWSTRLATGNVAFYMMGHAGLPTIDAYSTLSEVMATSGGALGGLNAGHYSNPAVDGLLTKISVEADPGARQALISQALATVKSDIAFIPLHQQPLIWGARAGVKLVQTPDNRFRLWLVRAE